MGQPRFQALGIHQRWTETPVLSHLLPFISVEIMDVLIKHCLEAREQCCLKTLEQAKVEEPQG